VRRHLVTEVAEKIHTQSRVQGFGQLDRCYTPLSSGFQIALLARSSQSIGQVREVDLSVPHEGLVEQGNALLEHPCRFVSMS
jgi:hypothetical protein